ncbi:cytochrome c-type biogenesis protein [Achromobacter sp.]|uniref:cytochrome c-type biogenesis protein n=1 Tax=Achromobacter sp. TaxID=134375 RepID=UPI003C75CB82
MKSALRALALSLALGYAHGAPASPDDRRVTEIASELRCLVCQNESIAASRADLAVDLRGQIRQQLDAGRTEAEILAYMEARYGDFILYRPRLKAATLLLWFGPAALLAAGLAALALTLRRRRARRDRPALTPQQRQAANALLGIEAEKGSGS